MEENPRLRLIGLDVGDKRIGVAISDPTCTISSPLPAINRNTLEKDIKLVLDIAETHNARTIVVGLPISLNGSIGPQAKKIKSFIKDLARSSTIPIESQDERFSTLEAERLLRESGHQPSRNRGLTDSASAAVILQSYIDSQGYPNI
jgi:putative Holliday junction resolvase